MSTSHATIPLAPAQPNPPDPIYHQAEDTLHNIGLILPCQLYEPPLNDRPFAALYRAVLDNLMCSLELNRNRATTRARRIVHEELSYVLADDWRWRFSFVNVCAYLDLNHEYLRRGVLTWYKSKRPYKKNRNTRRPSIMQKAA